MMASTIPTDVLSKIGEPYLKSSFNKTKNGLGLECLLKIYLKKFCIN